MHSTTDKRLARLTALTATPKGRDALERLGKVFRFGAALMSEYHVNTIPELPEDALARFLEYQENVFPGFSAKIFGGVQ